jgi:hypothetical protein
MDAKFNNSVRLSKNAEFLRWKKEPYKFIEIIVMNEKGKETSSFFIFLFMIIKFDELVPFLGKHFSPFSPI